MNRSMVIAVVSLCLLTTASGIFQSDHDMSCSDKDFAIPQASERGLGAFFDPVFEL